VKPIQVQVCPTCHAIAPLINRQCTLSRCPREFIVVTKIDPRVLAYYAMTPEERQERNDEEKRRRRSRYRERTHTQACQERQ
jgi:hypothetical protein